MLWCIAKQAHYYVGCVNWLALMGSLGAIANIMSRSLIILVQYIIVGLSVMQNSIYNSRIKIMDCCFSALHTHLWWSWYCLLWLLGWVWCCCCCCCCWWGGCTRCWLLLFASNWSAASLLLVLGLIGAAAFFACKPLLHPHPAPFPMEESKWSLRLSPHTNSIEESSNLDNDHLSQFCVCIKFLSCCSRLLACNQGKKKFSSIVHLNLKLKSLPLYHNNHGPLWWWWWWSSSSSLKHSV